MSHSNRIIPASTQVNLEEEENSSNHMKINVDVLVGVVNIDDFNDANSYNGSIDCLASPWTSQGYLLGASTNYPPPAREDSPIIPVIPRRRNRGMEGDSQLSGGTENTDNEEESLEPEDLPDRDDLNEEPREPRSAVDIVRNYPTFSQAAVAGYRYRTR